MNSFFRKFNQDIFARFGLYAVMFLLLLAVFAPLLSNEFPLLAVENGQISMPFFMRLFAPASPEKFVEKLFNYLLLLTFFYGFLKLTLWKFPDLRKYVFIAGALALLLPFNLVRHSLDKQNYRELYKDSNSTVIFAPIPYGPFEQVGTPYEKPSSLHILGTDEIGRSVASRVIYGARISLSVGLLSTALTLIIGSSIGLAIGYFKGKSDLLIMRLIEIINCFPTFLLLLILMALLKDRKYEQSVVVIILVIGLSSWIGVALLVRGEVLKQSALPYILSCKALGISNFRTLFIHLLPNVSSVIFISFSFGVAGAILAESSLSFLGFGVQAPSASWGNLLRQSFEDPLSYWHLTFFPGAALFLAVCGFNFLGEGVRKALDPKI